MTVAFLGLTLLNDNQELEPTSDAERARGKRVEETFKDRLTASGQFQLVPISASLAEKINAGRPPGSCNGCETSYAKEAGAEQAAWISVQKVSNLILNMNLYMGDVASSKMTFVHSVDIRGNTDESWQRSLNYLLDNYLLAPQPGG